MGENTAVILDPKSAADARRPSRSAPARSSSTDWAKGSSVTLTKWDGYRDAAAIKLKKVTFRFINDPAAQVAALLAGDVDGIPRFGAPQASSSSRPTRASRSSIGGTAGKTIMTINNKKKPFDDVRVRRALAAAIDRKAFIDGALEGFGKPIGSHMVPSDAGYVDLTGDEPVQPGEGQGAAEGGRRARRR